MNLFSFKILCNSILILFILITLLFWLCGNGQPPQPKQLRCFRGTLLLWHGLHGAFGRRLGALLYLYLSYSRKYDESSSQYQSEWTESGMLWKYVLRAHNSWLNSGIHLLQMFVRLKKKLKINIMVCDCTYLFVQIHNCWVLFVTNS